MDIISTAAEALQERNFMFLCSHVTNVRKPLFSVELRKSFMTVINMQTHRPPKHRRE